MITLIALLAASAPIVSEEAVSAYVEPCRRAARAAIVERDTKWLDRWLDRQRDLSDRERSDILLACAGYARGVDDLSRGRLLRFDRQ